MVTSGLLFVFTALMTAQAVSRDPNVRGRHAPLVFCDPFLDHRPLTCFIFVFIAARAHSRLRQRAQTSPSFANHVTTKPLRAGAFATRAGRWVGRSFGLLAVQVVLRPQHLKRQRSEQATLSGMFCFPTERKNTLALRGGERFISDCLRTMTP